MVKKIKTTMRALSLFLIVVLCASMCSVFALPVIDTTKTGSITIYKLDKTRIEIDGKTKTLADNPATGKESEEVYNELINNGSTYTIGNGQTSKGYAIKGVVYSYLKVADIVQYSEIVSGETKVMVLYEMDDTQDAALLAALGLKNEDAYPVQAGNSFTPASGKHYFESAVLTTALQTKLNQNSIALKNALETYMDDQNAGTFDPTDGEGKTTKNNLPLGLYLIVETSVPEMVTSTTAPFFVSIPMTEQVDDNSGALQASSTRPRYYYYSSIQTAVSDANEGTVGENEDAEQGTAVVSLFVDNSGLPNIVLLQNTTITSGLLFKRNAVLDLNGHKITAELGNPESHAYAVLVSRGYSLRINGQTLGSAIESNTGSGPAVTLLYNHIGSYLEVLGGEYTVNGAETTIGVCVRNYGNVLLKDMTINATAQKVGGITSGSGSVSLRQNNNIQNVTVNVVGLSDSTRAIDIQNAESTLISNCHLYANSDTESGRIYGIYINNTSKPTIIQNSEIVADSNYHFADGSYTVLSTGINAGTMCSYLLLQNCTVKGCHASAELHCSTDIDGGYYSSSGHGTYFTGSDAIYRVQGATLDNLYKGTHSTTNEHVSGAYIGGSQTSANIKIYADNTVVSGTSQSWVLRGTVGETNNALYISNSSINSKKIRIDNDTHKVYLGEGNDFTAADSTMPAAFVETNQNYSFVPQTTSADYNGQAIVGDLTPTIEIVPSTENSNSEAGAWLYDVVLYPKNLTGIPELEKLVRESKTDTGKNNGTDDITDGYAHTATASSGDKIDYLLLSRLPSITSETTGLTMYAFTDTLCKGLEYNGNPAALTMLKGNYNASDVSIKFFEDAACTTEITTWTADSGKFTVTYGTADNDATTMTVAMTAAGLREINSSTAVYPSSASERGYGSCYMKIMYSATMNQNADVVCGDASNQNTVTLTWKRSNMDYYDTLTDDCHVYTYSIEVEKQFDPVSTDFSSVEFKLYNTTDGCWVAAERISDGVYYVKGENKPAGWVSGSATEYSAGSPLVPGSTGTLRICGLEDDLYRLTETRTANGYNLLASPILIQITATGDTNRSCDIYSTDNRGVWQNKYSDSRYANTPYSQTKMTHDLLTGSATINGDTIEMKAEGSSSNAIVPLTIINGVGYQMPKTGAAGTKRMVVFGILGMCAGAGVIIYIIRRKKNDDDDDDTVD